MFIEAKDDEGGGDNWTTGAISRAKLHSNHHHQQTNIQFFTGRMPFLTPNQQCRSTEGKNITFYGLAYPKLTWGLPTLSLTTNSSWLPWGRVAMPLISPLMPVPRIQTSVETFFFCIQNVRTFNTLMQSTYPHFTYLVCLLFSWLFLSVQVMDEIVKRLMAFVQKCLLSDCELVSFVTLHYRFFKVA